MPSWRRALVAVALIVASASMPLLADECATSCDASHSAASASVPSCHHSASTTPRFRPAPNRCGHDHTAVVGVSTVTPRHGATATTHSPLVVCAVGASSADVHLLVLITPIDTSPPSSRPITRSLPLRI
jgi:hypothetical protein